MDGKASTATQGMFGHWELAPEPLSSSLLPEPLSPSHPPLHSNNYLTTATFPPVFRTPLVQKGKKGKEIQKRVWFHALGAERKDAYNTGYEKS